MINKNIKPQHTWRRMIATIISGLWRSRLWFNVASKPSVAFNLKQDFFGINIATSADPTCDDYIVQALHDLAIKQVRMHFSYDSVDHHGQRLLDRVLAEGFEVMLLSDCTFGRTVVEQEMFCNEIFPLFTEVLDHHALLGRLGVPA